jgi:hypothetical protein
MSIVPPKLDTGQVELLGRNWLATRLIRAGIEVARPERDVNGIDLIAYAPDLGWVTAIQLKSTVTGGLTVWDKYLGRPVAVVYVVLGDDDGGTGGRTETAAYCLTPEAAWNLPTQLGRKWDPSYHEWYRFGTIGKALLSALEPHRVCGW